MSPFITRFPGLEIALGYRYPEMFNYFIAAHKPQFGTAASNGKTIQNDSGIVNLLPGPALTPAVATLVSDDANDTVAGTGAQLVLVSGVDSDGYLRSEVVAMDGTTPVDTANEYYLIDNEVVIVVGAAGQQGEIGTSIDGLSMGAILPEFGALLTAHVLVPINYSYYVFSQTESATSNVRIHAVLQFNVFGGGTATSLANALYTNQGVSNIYFDNAPLPIPSGTYARFDAYGGSGDGASVHVDGVMVHNDLIRDSRGNPISAPPGTVYDVDSLTL